MTQFTDQVSVRKTKAYQKIFLHKRHRGGATARWAGGGKSQYRWETNGRERGLHKEQENKPDIPLPSPGVLCGEDKTPECLALKVRATYSGEIQTLWKRKTPLLKEKVPAKFHML